MPPITLHSLFSSTRILARGHFLAAFGCTLLLAVAARADDSQEQVFTDPMKAGPDYAVQGEYTGELGDNNDTYGAQIIAEGNGKFLLMGYKGGLPGAPWKRGDQRTQATGVTEDGKTTFQGDGWTGEISDGALVVTKDGRELGKMKKVQRKSPTLGAKPPEGAIVLFNGTSAENFENGEKTDDDLLKSNCWSKQKFGDHTLHLEFRTPFKPLARGQARGNSGVYAQSRYEIQVLDSFGLEGRNNECGGVYSIAEPKVNMCFPPLTWQTYDIGFTAARYDDQGNKTKNARLTLKHNGVVIHDDLELPKGTPGRAEEGPEPQGLYLQGHGNPVVYRNIWVIPTESKQE